MLVGAGGEVLERSQAAQMPDVRRREGLYQMPEELEPELRERWLQAARDTLEALAEEREREWAVSVGKLRDDELDRLGAFFSARIEEEEERQRRRAGREELELDHGDAMSLKLEWERRAAEVRQRWEMRTEVRLWGIEEWSWPVADVEQELRSGAMHVARAAVDVARRPALPPVPTAAVRPRCWCAPGTACCAACALPRSSRGHTVLRPSRAALTLTRASNSEVRLSLNRVRTPPWSIRALNARQATSPGTATVASSSACSWARSSALPPTTSRQNRRARTARRRSLPRRMTCSGAPTTTVPASSPRKSTSSSPARRGDRRPAHPGDDAYWRVLEGGHRGLQRLPG